MEFDSPVDDCCDTWQANDLKIPSAHQATSVSPDDQQFYIKFEVEFLHPLEYEDEDDDDDFEFQTRNVSQDFWLPCKRLECGNLTWDEISRMLIQLEVPLHKQPLMLHRISARADEMANASCNTESKVLPMMVSISVVADPILNVRDDGMGFQEISDLQRSIPAGKESVEALERVDVQEIGSDQDCAICLEGLEFGSRVVRRIPCSHLYHEGCIVNWLGVSNRCPLCRFELPA